MLWFMVQLALLLLAAYFAGAMLGCVVRRTFFPRTLVRERVAQPVPAAPVPLSAAPAVEQTRFERALTGAGATSPAPAPVPPPAAPPAAPAEPPAAKAPPAPSAPIPAAPAAPASPPPSAAATSAAVSAAMTAVAAAARAQQQTGNILPAASGTTGPATVTAPIAVSQPLPQAMPSEPPAAAPAVVSAPTPAPPAAMPADATQDLTRVRAIDDAMQKALHGLGVKTFADIAGWKPGDVVRVADALKIPGRIEQENWIEQAQILAKGGETYYSRRKLKGELPTARPAPEEGERITVRVPAPVRPATETAAQPPAAPAPAAAPPAAAPSVAAEAVAAAAAAAVQAAQAAVSSAAAVPATAPPPQAATAAPASPERPIGMARDPLQRIAGINAEVERLLNVQGVTRYAQVASWSQSDISRFDRLLGFEGRIARENWIEQAQILASGGETAYSRDYARRVMEASRPAKLADAIQANRPAETPAPASAPAASPPTDLSTLRSVRSEAYRGADAGAQATGRAVDDLKRIRGVGVLIEKKLNALGITRYDQIANWTQSEIDRFSEKLDFKGRIERENWVEQARILSAGGQTEFSQRVDRGEVETSKPRT